MMTCNPRRVKLPLKGSIFFHLSKSERELSKQTVGEVSPAQNNPRRGVGFMSDPVAPPPLYKQHSWSPDSDRDEAWLRRKGNNRRKRRTKSVTDEDLEELKACIELGFTFDSPDLDHRLSDTLPALELYFAINKQYNDTMSKSSSSLSSSSSPSSTTTSECDPLSPLGSPHTILTPGDNPQMVKTRLRQWAQVVACTLRQSC